MPSLRAELDLLRTGDLLRERREVEGAQGARLTFGGREYLAFCSNDYLGLANHPALAAAAQRGAQQFGIGAGASHLISGHASEHAALERELAAFVGAPAALYFSSGYLANIGTITALAGRDATIFSDQLNHACIIDGARLSRAQVRIYPHLDVVALENALATCTTARKLIATDAVFSMDGDLAPLPELLRLAERYDAWLLVDDAHGFGVLGARGRGALEHFGLSSRGAYSPSIVYMGTLGKAAGVAGAFVAAEQETIEYLVQRARSYVFTTAAPPLLASALRASLQVMHEESWRRDHLRALVGQLRAGLARSGWKLLASESAIQPIVVGDNARALQLMHALLERGIWVPAIRPPTVPAGTARLRVSLSAAHSAADVTVLCEELQRLQSVYS